MNNKPLVSIVIPVYNREAIVKETLESALSQSYENIEIVVVDNCSTDNTWEVISSYKSSKIRAYRNSENIGPVLNWKKGVKLSKGSYIKILYSDDLISENYIEESLLLFDSKVAFVLSPIRKLRRGNIGKSTFYTKKQYSTKEYFNNFYTQFAEMFPVSPGAALFRKKDIENAFISDIPTMGTLNPMKNGAGIDLLIYFNIATKYQIIRISEKSTAIFRVHEDSFSVSDTSILHYYFRAMIFFLSKLDSDRYYNLFKTLMYVYSKKEDLFKEEYQMINVSSFYMYFRPFYSTYISLYKLMCRVIRKIRSFL